MTSEFAPVTQAAAEAPLLSEQWFRVAELRPLLNAGVAAERVLYRGTPWMVMASPDGRRRVRLNLAAYALVGRCTGRHTLQQLWEVLLQEQEVQLVLLLVVVLQLL
jgi:putative peptide zinc metalloprotease protein